MNILKKIYDAMFRSHNEIIKNINTMETERKSQEQRIKQLAQATLNGESKWFLELVQKDPECTLKIIEDCHLNPKKAHSK